MPIFLLYFLFPWITQKRPKSISNALRFELNILESSTWLVSLLKSFNLPCLAIAISKRCSNWHLADLIVIRNPRNHILSVKTWLKGSMSPMSTELHCAREKTSLCYSRLFRWNENDVFRLAVESFEFCGSLFLCQRELVTLFHRFCKFFRTLSLQNLNF